MAVGANVWHIPRRMTTSAQPTARSSPHRRHTVTTAPPTIQQTEKIIQAGWELLAVLDLHWLPRPPEITIAAGELRHALNDSGWRPGYTQEGI